MQDDTIAKHIVETVQDAINRARESAGLVPDLLDGEQVARALGVARIVVKRLTASGELPHVTIAGQVKYNPADVAAFVRRNTSPHPLPEQPERISL